MDPAVFVAHETVVFGAAPAQLGFKRLFNLVLVIAMIKKIAEKFRWCRHALQFVQIWSIKALGCSEQFFVRPDFRADKPAQPLEQLA